MDMSHSRRISFCMHITVRELSSLTVFPNLTAPACKQSPIWQSRALCRCCVTEVRISIRAEVKPAQETILNVYVICIPPLLAAAIQLLLPAIQPASCRAESCA